MYANGAIKKKKYHKNAQGEWNPKWFGSKKTNSKSQSDEVSEVRQKPKQNNFIEMVEMQKKHERHHKVKIPGKHANHKLIPAQLVQDIAKG